MDIIQENIDELNGLIKVRIVEQDYMPKVEIALKDYAKKANIPGFRPGKTPKSVIMKMYGKSLIADEVVRTMQDSLSDYISKTEMDLLGRPVLKKDESIIDWETQREFEFLFDIGFVPKFNAEITKDDKVEYETIRVDDKLIDTSLNDIAKRYGKVQQMETIEPGDMLTGAFAELNADNEIKEGGISKADGYFFMDRIKEEDLKKNFLGLKKEDTVTVSAKQIADNPADLAGSLGIEKEVAENLESNFQFTVKGISRVIAAEINQEFLNRVYGEGIINSVEELRMKIKEDYETRFKSDSDNRFYNSCVTYLRNRIKFDLPVEFLKKTLHDNSVENISMEQIEKEFNEYEDAWKWDLIENKIATENHITVSEEEVKNFLRSELLWQFRQYNLAEIDEAAIDARVQELMKDKKNYTEARFYIKVGKMTELYKNKFSLVAKEVSLEEFGHNKNNK